MDQVDSEELVSAFEVFMSVYADEMGPHAVKIITHLVEQYKRLVSIDIEDDDGEALLAAQGCICAARRLIDACCKNKALLLELRTIMYPILMHGLTPDGLDNIEEVIDMIVMFVFYCSEPGQPIPAEMWRLYSGLLSIIAGGEVDPEGGYAMEYIERAVFAFINFIAKDPTTFTQLVAQEFQLDPANPVTYIQETFKAIDRILVVSN